MRRPVMTLQEDNNMTRYMMHLEEMEKVIPVLLEKHSPSTELNEAVNQLLLYARLQADLGSEDNVEAERDRLREDIKALVERWRKQARLADERCAEAQGGHDSVKVNGAAMEAATYAECAKMASQLLEEKQ